MQRRGFSRRPTWRRRRQRTSAHTRFRVCTHIRARARTYTHTALSRGTRGRKGERGRTERRRGGKRKSDDEGDEAAGRGERSVAVYLHASRYNTAELMPPTHRRYLRGLSYGDIFDRAIIPNTIYTARARRDARIARLAGNDSRPAALDRYFRRGRFVLIIRSISAKTHIIAAEYYRSPAIRFRGRAIARLRRPRGEGAAASSLLGKAQGRREESI